MKAHETAVVAASARVADDARIGPYAVIEADTEIGAGCEIRAHAVVKRFTTLGEANTVHESAILGGEPQDYAFSGEDSRLVIGSRNRIREGVTIHRAAAKGGQTRVGSECFLMAYAHVAHECVLGDHVILANNVALAGHVTIDDGAFLSGGVVVHQFCRVGRLAMVGGNTKLVQDALPFVVTDGHPGRPVGLNVVGLRRAGVGTAGLRSLKEAFRLLVRSAVPTGEACARLAESDDERVRELGAFAASARRGFGRARSE